MVDDRRGIGRGRNGIKLNAILSDKAELEEIARALGSRRGYLTPQLLILDERSLVLGGPDGHIETGKGLKILGEIIGFIRRTGDGIRDGSKCTGLVGVIDSKLRLQKPVALTQQGLPHG